MTEQKLQELLNSMSLEEKVNQLVQLTGNWYEENAVITGGMNGRQRMKSCGARREVRWGYMGQKSLRRSRRNIWKNSPITFHCCLCWM